MGESNSVLKEWLKSRPTKIDQGTFLQMMVMSARANDELDKDNAQLKADVNALSAALAAAENTITQLIGRVTTIEQKG
jgi:hypothetical protein